MSWSGLPGFTRTIAALSVVAAANFGCTTTPDSSPDAQAPVQSGDAGLLEPCNSSNDCRPPGFCSQVSGFCTQSCVASVGCPVGACSPQHAYCEAQCNAQSDCSQCTCGPTAWCSPGQGCLPISDVGGPCLDDFSCTSHNCGTYTKTCRVAPGTACTSSTCDICVQGTPTSTTPSLSFCSRACSSDSDCGGGLCVGAPFGGPAAPGAPTICLPSCNGTVDPSCPRAGPTASFSCVQVLNSSSVVCACNQTSTCSLGISNPVGGPCFDNSNCSSGVCAAYDFTLTSGVCTASCKQDSDCPSGAVCVSSTVPGSGAGVAATPGCLLTCSTMAKCAVGNCAARTDISGASVAVCDPHLTDGTACSSGSDCLSGTCASMKTCGPSGGAPNGGKCVTGADCASGNCENSMCHGTSKIGDSCTSSYDCSVGMCCSNGQCC